MTIIVKELISTGDEVIRQNKNYDEAFNCHNKNVWLKTSFACFQLYINKTFWNFLKHSPTRHNNTWS